MFTFLLAYIDRKIMYCMTMHSQCCTWTGCVCSSSWPQVTIKHSLWLCGTWTCCMFSGHEWVMCADTEIFYLYAVDVWTVMKTVNCALSALVDSVVPRELNSYGSRRGNDAVMLRSMFAHCRLQNKLITKIGPRTLHIPSNSIVSVSFLWGCSVIVQFNISERMVQHPCFAQTSTGKLLPTDHTHPFNCVQCMLL